MGIAREHERFSTYCKNLSPVWWLWILSAYRLWGTTTSFPNLLKDDTEEQVCVSQRYVQKEARHGSLEP